MSQKTRFSWQVGWCALLILFAAVVIFPIFWMVSCSLKTPTAFFSYPPKLVPEEPTWDNYQIVLTRLNFLRFILNTFQIAGLVVLGRLLACSLAAYAFARLRFKGRDAIFIALLATMMIPYGVIMIPLYVVMQAFGWIDTYLPLIVPPVLIYSYGTFLLRQFFKTIPASLEDSARIDGCNPFQIYYKIMLPQVKPALATVGVFSFLFSWNDFLGPLIFLSDSTKFTVSLALPLIIETYQLQWGLLMAGSVMAVIPSVAVFLSTQKYFVRSIVLSGIAGH